MKTIEERLKKYYEEFKDIPSYSPIVRNNQENDALELVVFDILYSKKLNIPVIKENAEAIANYIIAPPDRNIDLFIQYDDGDEFFFDVIQVKNSALDGKSLRTEMNNMQRTIKDFIKDPQLIESKSCRNILSKSDLDKNNVDNCTYYVVHAGDTIDFSGSEDNERIITKKQLEILMNTTTDTVESETMKVASYMKYNSESASNDKAVICSLNGYDLALLNNKYYSNERGRNILFGQNLREHITEKKSKTYKSMKETVRNTPENFWFFNNGITMVADSVEVDEATLKVKVNQFSIVNGAQTTSSLGLMLKETETNKDQQLIDNLKKVYVMARILQVVDEDTKDSIAIFNNTQNPITTRDMVARRPEQRALFDILIDENNYPPIYMEIRRGSSLPSNFNKSNAHRKTTNEVLAQIAFSAFFKQPFNSKDKKTSLFNNEFKEEYVINQYYHSIFNNEGDTSQKGILFKKTKLEIDEALFVKYLYGDCKKYLKGIYTKRIDDQIKKKDASTDDQEKANCKRRIDEFNIMLEFIGVCIFYFITLYFEFKDSFDTGFSLIRYDFDKFYSDKSFRASLVEKASNLFLINTIEIMKKGMKDSGKTNINNWVRSQQCQKAFLQDLSSEIASKLQWETDYCDFVKQFKINTK